MSCDAKGKGHSEKVNSNRLAKSSSKKGRNVNHVQRIETCHKASEDMLTGTIDNEFEPLNAQLDEDSKFIALMSSLQKHFTDEKQVKAVELICRKLISLSEQNNRLLADYQVIQLENQKLINIKQKLENLCRELQKSNNLIRNESLDLIKLEQKKAKEQTSKIQSTLSGVMKLFDENQQRSISLHQENQELQMKQKSLLDHCDDWEKGFEVVLNQRDVDNKLLKTELAKANLLRNEETEKFLREKQELLQIISLMQEHQKIVEGQEAKLRSDLNGFSTKYQECQTVISKGMNRFQTESKKMLKQIENSKQEYKILLSKYDVTNKKLAQLLDEKQSWDRSISVANKKIDTLEKICRALSQRNPDNKKASIGSSTSDNDKCDAIGSNCNRNSEQKLTQESESSPHKSEFSGNQREQLSNHGTMQQERSAVDDF